VSGADRSLCTANGVVFLAKHAKRWKQVLSKNQTIFLGSTLPGYNQEGSLAVLLMMKGAGATLL